MWQRICCLHQKIELKYHGLLDYYSFAKKYDRLSLYFSSQVIEMGQLEKTIQILLKSDRNECMYFLFSLAKDLYLVAMPSRSL
jgi:hypothetical protein